MTLAKLRLLETVCRARGLYMCCVSSWSWAAYCARVAVSLLRKLSQAIGALISLGNNILGRHTS